MKRLLFCLLVLLCAGCAPKSIVTFEQPAIRLIYRCDRETSETYEITDAKIIRDVKDALALITIGKQSDIRTTDADDIFTFITQDGSEYTYTFEQHRIVLDQNRYEIFSDQTLWKLTESIRKEE